MSDSAHRFRTGRSVANNLCVRRLDVPIHRQFLTFASVGAVSTAIHYLVLIALVRLGAMSAVLASVLGFAAGAASNYWLNYRVTFRSSRRHRDALSSFMLVAGTGLVLNTLIMATFVQRLGVHYLVSQVVATVLVLIWNFLANRAWTFSEGTNVEP